jgi:NADH-quinone oxidoreductase subunit J
MGDMNIFLLVVMLIVTVLAVMTSGLLRAALGLAVVSALLSVIMYRLNSPIAAVYELSVCAGLIPVIFITVISLTKPLKRDEAKKQYVEKFNRFWPLPVIILVASALLAIFVPRLELKQFMPEYGPDVKEMVWSIRQMDLIGQIAVLLVGAYAILILYKEMRRK